MGLCNCTCILLEAFALEFAKKWLEYQYQRCASGIHSYYRLSVFCDVCEHGKNRFRLGEESRKNIKPAPLTLIVF